MFIWNIRAVKKRLQSSCQAFNTPTLPPPESVPALTEGCFSPSWDQWKILNCFSCQIKSSWHYKGMRYCMPKLLGRTGFRKTNKQRESVSSWVSASWFSGVAVRKRSGVEAKVEAHVWTSTTSLQALKWRNKSQWHIKSNTNKYQIAVKVMITRMPLRAICSFFHIELIKQHYKTSTTDGIFG